MSRGGMFWGVVMVCSNGEGSLVMGDGLFDGWVWPTAGFFGIVEDKADISVGCGLDGAPDAMLMAKQHEAGQVGKVERAPTMIRQGDLDPALIRPVHVHGFFVDMV